MKKKSNQKLWREFEHLVEMIERCLSKKGAVVKSPDFIFDFESRKNREVDISIRYKIGSTPILIIFECRRRKRLEDVQWIEQIKSKKDALHANSAVVVSSEGFTKDAINKAKNVNIETRILKDITEEEIENWSNSLKMCYFLDTQEIKQIEFKYPKQLEKKAHKIISSIQASKIAIETKFLKQIKNGSLLSIQDYLFQYQRDKGLEFDKHNRSLFNFEIKLKESFKGTISVKNIYPALYNCLGRKPIEQKKQVNFHIEFENEEVALSSTIGDVMLLEMDIEFEVQRKIYPLVFSQIAKYLNDKNKIASIGKGEISLSNFGRMEIIATKNFTPEKN